MLKKFLVLVAALLTLAAMLSPAPAEAQSTRGPNNGLRPTLFQVTVNVENLAPADGTAQTPVWVGIHDGSFDLYDRGAPVSAGLESLAEDGATAGISAEFAASGAGIDATIASNQGIPPLLPGESGSFTFLVESVRGQSQYLSYASMILPSNDAFVANGNPIAIPVFNDRNRFVPADFVVSGDEVLDAGTEVNDELEATTAFFGQAAPNTGVTEGGGVELHPGFIPNGRILSEPRFQNADFLAEGVDTLRISTSASRVTRVARADINGAQTVDNVDTDADGWTRLRVRPDGTISYQVRVNNLDGLAAAHLHLAAPGANGPVIVNLLDIAPARIRGANNDRVGLFGRISNDDLVGPLAGLTIFDLWSEIQAGNVYINIHTAENPAGEVRGNFS